MNHFNFLLASLCKFNFLNISLTSFGFRPTWREAVFSIFFFLLCKICRSQCWSTLNRRPQTVRLGTFIQFKSKTRFRSFTILAPSWWNRPIWKHSISCFKLINRWPNRISHCIFENGHFFLVRNLNFLLFFIQRNLTKNPFFISSWTYRLARTSNMLIGIELVNLLVWGHLVRF